MTPEQQQSTIRYLAERLGLPDYLDRSLDWHTLVISGEFDDIYIHAFEDNVTSWVILFASYVKAKMYEIGWVTWWDFCDRFAFYQKGKGCAMPFYEFDPSDPLSEAYAILDAAAEALGMEQETTNAN